MPPHGHIASIGICSFNPLGDEIYDSRYWVMNKARQTGAWIDPDTVHWWMQQSDAARDAITYYTPKIPLADAFVELAKWYEEQKCTEIWAMPVTFDIVLLENAYKREKRTIPWSYRQVRDFSTIKRSSLLNNYIGDMETVIREGTHHNAVDDAIHQAKQLQKTLKAVHAKFGRVPKEIGVKPTLVLDQPKAGDLQQ
jgi:hypothetical protein